MSWINTLQSTTIQKESVKKYLNHPKFTPIGVFGDYYLEESLYSIMQSRLPSLRSLESSHLLDRRHVLDAAMERVSLYKKLYQTNNLS